MEVTVYVNPFLGSCAYGHTANNSHVPPQTTTSLTQQRPTTEHVALTVGVQPVQRKHRKRGEEHPHTLGKKPTKSTENHAIQAGERERREGGQGC